MPKVNPPRVATMREASRNVCKRLRNFVLAALGGLAVALAAIGAGTDWASAQEAEATGAGGIQYFVTPYLWLAGVYATTQTPLARASEVDSSVGPFEMLGDLKGAPFMGSAEIRVGPIGLLGDVLHVPFGTNITTRNVFFQGGKAALTTNTGTALVLYRVLEAPNQFSDFGIGFRSWGFGANLSLNPGLLPGVSVNQRGGWGDPLIGGRYHYDFGNGFGATAYGEHRLSQSQLQLFDRGRQFGFQRSYEGPIFAGTFRF